MKARLLPALLLGTLLVAGGDDARPADKFTHTYHVSAGGDNKALLMRVFGAVKKVEEAKTGGGSRRYTVRQRISPTEFLVNSGGNEDYWFIALKGEAWDSREQIRADTELTDATRTFLNESGETVKVRVLKQVKSKPPPEFTKEEFVQRLKDGQTWVLVDFEKRKCEHCEGDGKVETESGIENCDECTEGMVSIDYVVEW